MIVLRTTTLSERTLEFGKSLATASGAHLVFLVDGRHPVTLQTEQPVLRLTKQGCEDLGLYCPDDFAWRCGDYGLYLARAAFPSVRFFWLIEYDVRFAGGPPEPFFRRFDAIEDDMLALDYRPSEDSYRWYKFSTGKGVTPYRCLFSMIRLSSRALDLLLAKRVAQGKTRQRRLTWPNDESFVATTLTNAGMSCRDINDFGVAFYDLETCGFFNPIDGDSIDLESGALRVLHPVLFGEDYRRKVERLRTRPGVGPLPQRIESRLRRQINRYIGW